MKNYGCHSYIYLRGCWARCKYTVCHTVILQDLYNSTVALFQNTAAN